jgi:WD40 repeat protein
VALRACGGRLVLFIDEIDVVRSLPFSADEFFAAIRECYNRRSQDRALEGLTFCLLGVASPSDLIREVRTTPFNIGVRIELSDFTPEEARPLAAGLRGGNRGKEKETTWAEAEALLARVLHWTGGHPYLTQRLCRAVSEATLPGSPGWETPLGLVDGLCRSLFLSDAGRQCDDNLLFVRERLLRSEVDRMALLDLYGRVRRGRRLRYEETNPLCEALRLAGIVRVERGRLRVRNRIYAQAFDGLWVEAHQPDAELRRQRAAYRRGLLRALTLSSVILCVVIGLAAYGFWQADLAKRNARSEQERRLQADKATALYKEAAAELRTARDIADRQRREADRQANRARAAQQAERLAETDALRKAKQAKRNADLAERQRDEAEHLVYISDLNLIQDSYGKSNFARVLELLAQTSKNRFRGFEWNYWQRHYNLDLTDLQGHNDALDNVPPVAISPDGKRTIAGRWDGTAEVRVIETGRRLLTLPSHPDIIWSAAFSQDGRYIATGCKDHFARIWDAHTGRLIQMLRGHSDMVRAVAFSPDGVSVATASGDGTAKLWDIATGRTLRTLVGHQNRVDCIAFSPDGTRIATGSDDQTARIWDTATGQNVCKLSGHNHNIYSIAFSPDGKRIVTGSWDDRAGVWDVETGRNLFMLSGDNAEVWAVAYSPDGKRIATASLLGDIRFWDAATGQLLVELKGHRGEAMAVAFSPDGRQVITGGQDGRANVWEARTGAPKSGAFCVFTSAGRRIVTADREGKATIRDEATGRPLLKLNGHGGIVRCAAFSADGKRIVTGDREGVARLWDATNGRQLLTMRGHQGEITCAAIASDGQCIATGSADKTVKLWDVATGSCRSTLVAHRGWITSVAFSPDSRRLVTGGQDNMARVWSVVTGETLAILAGHTDQLTTVAFSPDSRRIITGSWDKTVRIWDADLGRSLLILPVQFGRIDSVAFSANGKRIAMRGAAGAACDWYSEPSDSRGAVATTQAYQIGAGGEGAPPFSADAYFQGGILGGLPLISFNIATDGVLNPAPQAVYLSERYGNCSYTFPNLNSHTPYLVRLHFTESYFGSAGIRLFNVTLNNRPILTNFDIYHSASTMRRAVIEQFDAVADPAGNITLAFSNVTGGAKINAIEILPCPYYSRSGWTASVSSSARDWPPARAIDGTTGTRWSAGAPQTRGQWFQVDMRSVHSFSKIVLDNTNSPQDFPRGYAVMVSNDGIHWSRPIAAGSNAGLVSRDYTLITVPRRTARYIRVQQTGSADYWWSIAEFYVYP